VEVPRERERERERESIYVSIHRTGEVCRTFVTPSSLTTRALYIGTPSATCTYIPEYTHLELARTPRIRAEDASARKPRLIDRRPRCLLVLIYICTISMYIYAHYTYICTLCVCVCVCLCLCLCLYLCVCVYVYSNNNIHTYIYILYFYHRSQRLHA
jgi:hypothetical protein